MHNIFHTKKQKKVRKESINVLLKNHYDGSTVGTNPCFQHNYYYLRYDTPAYDDRSPALLMSLLLLPNGTQSASFSHTKNIWTHPEHSLFSACTDDAKTKRVSHLNVRSVADPSRGICPICRAALAEFPRVSAGSSQYETVSENY